MHYAWASPTYLLNEMSLELILMYYDYMVIELTGEDPEENKEPEYEQPDRKKFHEMYGDKIKTPG